MNSFNNLTVTEIHDIVTVFSHSGRHFQMHNRTHYGISFCSGGQITYTHNGNHYISDPTHGILLPKGQNYKLYGDKTGNFPVINFDCTGFSSERFIVFPLRNPDSYLRDFERMKALALFGTNRAGIMSIFYEMLQRISTEQVLDADILKPALSYLEQHYTDPQLSNSLLAQMAGISEVYFRRLFTSKMGITPRQHILDIRIKRAKQLLTESSMTVSAIAEQCGFANVYHFCRAFKAKTGFTPTEYTKRNRKWEI